MKSAERFNLFMPVRQRNGFGVKSVQYKEGVSGLEKAFCLYAVICRKDGSMEEKTYRLNGAYSCYTENHHDIDLVNCDGGTMIENLPPDILKIQKVRVGYAEPAHPDKEVS